MTRTVLLTGFEPFDGEFINPSAQAVDALAGSTIEGHRVGTALLPVRFEGAIAALREAISAQAPALVIGVGQAGGRARIGLERVALNLIDARIPDNAGAQPVDVPVIDGAPPACFSSLPVKAILAELAAGGVPAELSLSAGTYVCNAVFFALMRALPDGARGGFIHIPYLPEQAVRHPGAPSMALATAVEGLRIAVATALATPEDLATPGGEVA